MDINELTLGQIKEIKQIKQFTGDCHPPRKETTDGVKIVILQRGWAVVGRFYRRGPNCRVEGGSVIRRWGTSNGLGEIATGGPTENTKLDAAPTIRFHELTIVATMDCEADKWANHIR